MIAPLNEGYCTSEIGMVIVSASDCHGSVSVDRSGHVEHPWIVVILPPVSGPEDILVPDFEHHY